MTNQELIDLITDFLAEKQRTNSDLLKQVFDLMAENAKLKQRIKELESDKNGSC